MSHRRSRDGAYVAKAIATDDAIVGASTKGPSSPVMHITVTHTIAASMNTISREVSRPCCAHIVTPNAPSVDAEPSAITHGTRTPAMSASGAAASQHMNPQRRIHHQTLLGVRGREVGGGLGHHVVGVVGDPSHQQPLRVAVRRVERQRLQHLSRIGAAAALRRRARVTRGAGPGAS